MKWSNGAGISLKAPGENVCIVCKRPGRLPERFPDFQKSELFRVFREIVRGLGFRLPCGKPAVPEGDDPEDEASAEQDVEVPAKDGWKKK